MSGKEQVVVSPQWHQEAVRDLLWRTLDIPHFEVWGQENLEFARLSAAIYVFAPHNGHLDAPAVRKSMPAWLRPKMVVPAPKDYWGRPGWNLLGGLALNTIPMARAQSGSKAIDEGLNMMVGALQTGFSPILAPEGTRGNPVIPLEQRVFKPGVTEILLRTKFQFPVVPVRLFGFEDIMPRGTVVPSFFTQDGRRKTLYVAIGKPITFTPPKDGVSKSWWRAGVMEELKDRLIHL